MFPLNDLSFEILPEACDAHFYLSIKNPVVYLSCLSHLLSSRLLGIPATSSGPKFTVGYIDAIICLTSLSSFTGSSSCCLCHNPVTFIIMQTQNSWEEKQRQTVKEMGGLYLGLFGNVTCNSRAICTMQDSIQGSRLCSHILTRVWVLVRFCTSRQLEGI